MAKFGSLGFLGATDPTSDFLAQSYGLGDSNVPSEVAPIGSGGSWWEDLLNAGVDVTRANDAAKAAANLAAYRVNTPIYNPSSINQLQLTPAQQQAALVAGQTQATAFNLTGFLTNNWLPVVVVVGGLLLYKSGR